MKKLRPRIYVDGYNFVGCGNGYSLTQRRDFF
ncbi:hypothetical protein ABIE56_003853 [Luteibacter sp. 621]|jgi:hypothetical protein